MFSSNPPLGLYIHLPWCVKKCPYCDFNSHPLKTALPVTEYVDALLADLQAQLELSGVQQIPAIRERIEQAAQSGEHSQIELDEARAALEQLEMFHNLHTILHPPYYLR